MRTRLTKLFPPHTLPYCPEVKKIAKSGNFDLIITSEVFSLNSLKLALCTPKNLIVWQELGKHNRIFHGLASNFGMALLQKQDLKKRLLLQEAFSQGNLFQNTAKMYQIRLSTTALILKNSPLAEKRTINLL